VKKLRIYLDTSVIGGCFDDEFAEDSLKLVDEIKKGTYTGVFSEVTIKEILRAPVNVRNVFETINNLCEKLALNEQVTNLAEEYVSNGIISKKYADDAAHIAYSSVYNVDILVSWNFKHIVNFNKIIQFNAVNISNGYKPLQIYPPRVLISK